MKDLMSTPVGQPLTQGASAHFMQRSLSAITCVQKKKDNVNQKYVIHR